MLSFRAPQLATATELLPVGTWVAEQKYDGVRRILVREGNTAAWYSRTGKTSSIPPQILKEALCLPAGVYDGEDVVPGGTSSDVADLSNVAKRHYVIFDMLEDGVLGDLTTRPWTARRNKLEAVFDHLPTLNWITLAEQRPVSTWQQVEELASAMWELGCEGLILKDVKATYRCGKRTKTFLKVKQWKPALMKIVGFVETKGEIMQRGEYAMTLLQDADGVLTIVKTLDDETIAKLEKEAPKRPEHKSFRLDSNRTVTAIVNHPWCGRGLWIEFQQRGGSDRTVNGTYNHPHWDHFDDE